MRCGCLILLLIVMPLVLALAAFIGVPAVRCAAFNAFLPRTWKKQDYRFTINEVRGNGLIARDDQVRATLPAGRAQAIAGCFWQGWLLRGGSVAGCAAAGTCELPDLGPGSRSWQLLITDDSATTASTAPQVIVHLPLADLNHALAHSLTSKGPVTGCILTRAHLRSIDAPTPDASDRTITLDAAGDLTCRLLDQAQRIPVRNLVATLRIHFALDGDYFRPSASVTIVTLDSPAFDLPLVGAQARTLVIPTLEDAIDQALAHQLADVRLPGWFPTDLGIEAEGR
jgi:hypothetical protein